MYDTHIHQCTYTPHPYTDAHIRSTQLMGALISDEVSTDISIPRISYRNYIIKNDKTTFSLLSTGHIYVPSIDCVPTSMVLFNKNMMHSPANVIYEH